MILQNFEVNNTNISLTVIDDDKNILYISHNISSIKAKIVKLKNNRYATIKPVRNKSIKLKEILRLFQHEEISDVIKKYHSMKYFFNECQTAGTNISFFF